MAEAAEKFKPKMPDAVRRQSRAADRAHASAYKPAAPEGEASVASLQAGLTVPPQEPGEAPAQATPAPAAATPQGGNPPPPPAPESPPPPPVEDWEQKYRSLQGMMEREVREKRSLENRIAGLEQTLAAVSSIQEQAPKPKDNGKWQRRLQQEDVEAYGEDMVKMVRAAAHDEFMPVIEQLQAENAELKEQLGQVTRVTQQSAVSTVESLLDREVPDWKRINTDPEFLDWLAEEDTFSGRTRHELINEAGTNGPRVVSFFKAYLNEKQAIRGHQEAGMQAPQQGQAPAQGPTVDKASLVAPGRPASPKGTGAGAAVDGEEQKFFTQKQIAAFYREVQQGKWKHRPAEKEKREREIHKAAMEGRVRA